MTARKQNRGGVDLVHRNSARTYFFFSTAMRYEFSACGYVDTVHVAVTYRGCRTCKENLKELSCRGKSGSTREKEEWGE